MKSKQSKTKVIDIYSKYEDSDLEYVSPDDERETLQSLGVFRKLEKSCYNSDHDDNYFERLR